MVDQPRFDTVAHTPSWSGASAPTGIRPSPETSTKHRRSIGTLASVEVVSSEEAMGAASCLSLHRAKTRDGGRRATDALRRPRLLDSPRPQQDEETPWAGLQGVGEGMIKRRPQAVAC